MPGPTHDDSLEPLPDSSEEEQESSLEIERIHSEEEDDESVPPDYKLVTYPADFTLEVLHNQWKNGDIEIPDFQRRYVWKQPQASRLIESFLVGLPVPAVFLYRDQATQKHLVIDGQQRLRSVFDYIEGYFHSNSRSGNRKTFQLLGLHDKSPFHKKSFDDLLPEDRRRFVNSVLRAFIVQQLDPDDDTSMIHIFERLNTGGTLLSNQEIRNCLYHGEGGKYIKFLQRINKFPPWRKILGKDKPDSRGKDLELIIRFFSMMDIGNYRKPMKDYMSNYMRKNKDVSDSGLRDMESLFEQTCCSVVTYLGEKPFHVKSGLNAAVFDSVMVNFSQNLGSIPCDIRQRYNRLIADEQFENSTRAATTDVDVIRRRFRMVSGIMFNKQR